MIKKGKRERERDKRTSDYHWILGGVQMLRQDVEDRENEMREREIAYLLDGRS